MYTVYTFAIPGNESKKLYVSFEWDSYMLGDSGVSDIFDKFGVRVKEAMSGVSGLKINKDIKKLFPSYKIVSGQLFVNNILALICNKMITFNVWGAIIPLDGYRLYMTKLSLIGEAQLRKVWILFKYPECYFCGSYVSGGDLQYVNTPEMAKLLMEGRLKEFE